MASWSLPCPSTCCPEPMAGARLSLSDLSVHLSDGDRRFVLETGVLEIAAGEPVGLSGGSGTGKTLLLEVLGLLRQPDPGGRFTLHAQGREVDLRAEAGQAARLRGRYFGFVPQAGGLLPFLTVAENIALSQKITDTADAAWIGELIARLGLAGLERLTPSALSIGQRQRVSIARALAHRPLFVIADEPTAALDPEAAETAMGLLIEAAEQGGAAVIVSSHDLGLLDRVARRRVHLSLAPAAPGTVRSVLAARTEAAA